MEPTAADRPRRRWLQFSLKTLLVLLTVFGIWLGVVVNRAHRQRHAAEALREMGWAVGYDDIEDIDRSRPVRAYGGAGFVDHADALPWRHRVLGRDLFSVVVEVRPSYVAALNDNYLNLSLNFPERYPAAELTTTLAHVAQLTEVTALHLDTLPLGDEGLAFLRDLWNLEELGLSQTQITDAGLAQLSRMDRLRRLDLSQTDITDEGLKHLRGLASLELLNLDGTRVTPFGAAYLQTALTRCAVNGPQRFVVPEE